MTETVIRIPTLATERLILRAPRAADLPRLTAAFSTLRRHMVGGPRDAAETWKSLVSRLGHWVIKGFGPWQLTEKSNGDYTGATIGGNDAVYRHPSPSELDGIQLAHGIEMEISHYADPRRAAVQTERMGH